MDTPIRIDFEYLDWQPHPTIPGIEIKLQQNQAGFPPKDVLIARVAAAGEIPWHVHETDSEIAYVIEGAGMLFCSQDESHETISTVEMSTDSAVIIPPGLWHRVQNVGISTLLIFAAHTPA